MDSLIKASAEIIVRKSPSRGLLTKTPLATALGAYLLVSVLQTTESFIAPGEYTGYGIATLCLLSLLVLVSVLLMQMWFLNTYARQKFSLKEVFVLEILFILAPSIVLLLIYFVILFSGLDAVVNDAVGAVFSIYVLFAYQKALVDIARISKSQAAIIILVSVVTALIVTLAGVALLFPRIG